MSESPYLTPNATNIVAPTQRLRFGLHAMGLMISAVAAFFTHALATKVPAGELQVSRSTWLVTALGLVSVSVFVLGGVLVSRCCQSNTRTGLLYLLSPIVMLGYFAYRLMCG